MDQQFLAVVLGGELSYLPKNRFFKFCDSTYSNFEDPLTLLHQISPLTWTKRPMGVSVRISEARGTSVLQIAIRR